MKNDNHKWDNKHPTAQMLGRWQPWHAGHQKLFEEIDEDSEKITKALEGLKKDNLIKFKKNNIIEINSN